MVGGRWRVVGGTGAGAGLEEWMRRRSKGAMLRLLEGSESLGAGAEAELCACDTEWLAYVGQRM